VALEIDAEINRPPMVRDDKAVQLLRRAQQSAQAVGLQSQKFIRTQPANIRLPL